MRVTRSRGRLGAPALPRGGRAASPEEAGSRPPSPLPPHLRMPPAPQGHEQHSRNGRCLVELAAAAAAAAAAGASWGWRAEPAAEEVDGGEVGAGASAPLPEVRLGQHQLRDMTQRKRIFDDSSRQSNDEDSSTSVSRNEDGHNNEENEDEHNEENEDGHNEENEDGQNEEAQEADVYASVARIKKRGRGNSTLAFFACKNGQRHELQWNKLGQVIGPNEKKFRSACAYYARCHWLWPLDKKWKKMPNSALVETWKLLEKDFILDGHPNALSFVSDVIHRRLIDWKNRVKRIWEDNHREPDVMKANVRKNPRIDFTQFLNLVKEWEMPESKAKAFINKMNRNAKAINHKSGKHSLAVLREKFEKENNREPSDVDLMKIMYPNTEEAKTMEVNVQKIQSQRLEAPLEEVEKEAYVRAVKPVREDYVRFRGIGHDKSHNQSEHERLQELIQKSSSDQEKIKNLEEDVASLKVLIKNFGERMEQRDFIIHQQATLLQQLGHYVGFPDPHSYIQNANDFTQVSGSVGGTNDDRHDSGSSGYIPSDADDRTTTSSRCPSPFVGGHPTSTQYGYPQMYPSPPFSRPPQVQFPNQHHGSQVDTPPSHPKGRQFHNVPIGKSQTSSPTRPSSYFPS